MPDNWIDRELTTLNPDADHARMVDLIINWRDSEPKLVHLLYALTFIRQVAVPHVADVVWHGGGGKLIRATERRTNDTLHALGQLWRHGPGSPEAAATIARMNAMHRALPVTNDDFLATLSTIVLGADDLFRRIGAPPRPDAETRAMVGFWNAAGRQMGITGIPDTARGFAAFRSGYEARHVSPSAAGQACAETLVADFAARWFTDARRGRALILSVIDPALHRVFVFDYPGPLRGGALRAGLLARGLLRRFRSQPRQPRYVTDSFPPRPAAASDLGPVRG